MIAGLFYETRLVSKGGVSLGGEPGGTPANITSSTGNPTYTWPAVDGANSYQFFLGGQNGAPLPLGNPNSPNLTDRYVFETLNASQVCQNGACTFDATTVSGIAWLTNGSYEVWLCANNSDCNLVESWKGPYVFTINVPSAPAPLPNGGTTTTLAWVLSGNAANMSWFQMYVAPSANLGNSVVFGWYSRQQICGSWGATTCTWTLPQSLTAGTEYQVWVQSWNPAGISTGGSAGWAGPFTFTP